MTERQVVNLRHGVPVLFGSSDEQRAWELEAAKLRASTRFEFCIAPRVHLRVPRGLLEEGAEVRLEDIIGPTGEVDRRRWHNLVARGVILVRDE